MGEHRMGVKRVQIDNIMGIEHLEFEPGKVTLIEGANAAGKTSALEALKAALGGGNDATLIRAGQDTGEVVVVFDNGTEVWKRLRREGRADLAVKHPDMGRISAGQTWVDGILDAVSFNPVEFLVAGSDRQMEMILESAAVDMDTDKLVRIAAGAEVELREDEIEAIETWDGLRAIEYVRKRIYDERTGVNRSLRDKRGTVQDLEAAVDEAEDPEDIQNQIGETEEFILEMQGVMETEIQDAKDRIITEHRDQLNDIDHEIEMVDQKIQALQENRAALKARRTRVQETAATEVDAATRRIQEQTEPILQGKRENLRALRERQKYAERAAGARERLTEARAGAETLAEEAETLTAALDAVDAVKAEQFNSLPIEDLEIRDGALFVGDIPLQRLNRARLMEIAFWIAERRAGDLGIVIVDGLEALDTETFDSFVRHARERSNLQYIVTRVADGDLNIRTEEEA